VAFSEDGKYLATGTLPGARLLDINPDSVVSSPVTSLPVGKPQSVWALAYSPDHRSLAVGTAGGTQIWDLTTRTLTETLPAGTDKYVYSLAFNSSGTLLAAGTGIGTIQLWNLASPRRTPTVTLPAGKASSFVPSIAFSPGGKLLAAGTSNGIVDAWSLASTTPAPIAALSLGKTKMVDSVAFSPAGNILAAGANDGTTHLWHATSQALNPAGTLTAGGSNGIKSIAFRPDGKVLAVATAGGTVQQWDLATRHQASTPILDAEPAFPALAFSRDGTTLIIGSAAGIQLWDTGTQQQLGVLPANSSDTFFRGALVALSPAGTFLAVATSAGTVQLWSMPYLTDPATYLCGLAGQPFPQSQWATYAPGLPYQATCP
jgi:WD40 repeat protein